ncbi:MAG: hypothetical protein WCA39_10520 [Nitrososphaeraceae archaeon]|jgi:hypothetical protein
MMKRNVSSFGFSETRIFLMVFLVISTALIPIGLNQIQNAVAQQLKLKGLQNNQTSSSLTKQ